MQSSRIARPFSIALVVTVLLAGGAMAWSGLSFASFMGAPAGTPVAFAGVALPPVGQGSPAAVCAGALSRRDLLTGNTVVTKRTAMKAHWDLLFDVPFDPSLFDFDQDFVVITSGGKLDIQGYGISSVERVDADWFSFMFGGAQKNKFLAVTATKTLPGIWPPNPPPPTWRLSAVRVPLAELDDVVFHETVIAAP